jgi:proteasome lid subunit RPN8/RPN11
MKPETLQAIGAAALLAYPNESCGLVAIVDGAETYFDLANTASSKSEHFVIDPKIYARVEDQGEIIAVVHSHPDAGADPSHCDLVECEKSGLPWVIASVIRHDDHGAPWVQEFRSIEPSGYQAPLVGREFSHGVLDCYTLVQDWFKRERGVQLPDFDRVDNWWDDGKSDLYTQEGFEKIGFEILGAPGRVGELQVGDVVVMQIRSKNGVPNHAGVYIGDSMILHHLHSRLSERCIYGGMWMQYTRFVARYKGLA